MKWRFIPGFMRFKINEAGEVRRAYRIGNHLPGPVKASINGNGYLSIAIRSDDDKVCKLGIHQLMMLAYVGPPPTGMCVCHNNGQKLDNRISNLRYDTQLANNHDRKLHGTLPIGEKCAVSVLDEKTVIDIYQRCVKGQRQADIAREYGITQACVSAIFTGRNWKHLNLPRIPSVRKFSYDDCAKMRQMLADGVIKSEIARRFNTSPQAVHYCLSKKELAA